jgi:fatty acid desaturase
MKFTFRKLCLLRLAVIDCLFFVEHYLDDTYFYPEDDNESVDRTPSRARAITRPWGELHVYP